MEGAGEYGGSVGLETDENRAGSAGDASKSLRNPNSGDRLAGDGDRVVDFLSRPR